MEPDQSKIFEQIFSLTSFTRFIESVVENPTVQAALDRPLKMILQLDNREFRPWDWLDYLDEAKLVGFPVELDSYTQQEWYLMERWLLDKVIREYGGEDRKKGKISAYDLAGLVLHRISGFLPSTLLVEILEGYLPMVADHKLASDIYHWLFVHSFNDEEPKLEAFIYAHQGLERSKKSGDKDRIAWGWYNLIHYHSYFDVDQAEEILDSSVEFLRDERYYDLLGHIALGRLEQGFTSRAENYLEKTYEFFQQAVDNDTLLDMDTIAFSLVSFAEHLGWHYFDQNRYRECSDVMQKLIRLLTEDKTDFLALAAELNGGPDDYAYHYHGYLADAYLWTYACFQRQGLEEERLILAADFKAFLKACPFDLRNNIDEFFEEMQIDFPWD